MLIILPQGRITSLQKQEIQTLQWGQAEKKLTYRAFWQSITKQATKDTNTCFLHLKKLKLGRSSTETILHFLTFHQHCKDMNIGVKPSACYSSSTACNSNQCGKQRSWETYLAFIYDCVSKTTLFLGCQPSFFFTYLSQLIQNTLRWKKNVNRIHRNKEQLGSN